MAHKDRGGLGIDSLWDSNLAMLAKWRWRFKTDNGSLWRKVIWSIHQSSRVWNFIPRKLVVSGVWKQIVKVAKDVEKLGYNLDEQFRCVLGDGRLIFF
ncbi:hypothetical protein HanIR_Chr09g0413511 [Helianthus annuus]|nr:hypothetical protein HanIR_Chr09g0413511 [Helianthus annuus]